MAKRVATAVARVLESTFGMDTERRYVGCDDGTTYVFAREYGSPRWYAQMRISAGGERSPEPSRLPRSVRAHMDGHTHSGPHGRDGEQYWVS